jgi:hypothetical protein
MDADWARFLNWSQDGLSALARHEKKLASEPHDQFLT